jgi:hypothetical protein
MQSAILLIIPISWELEPAMRDNIEEAGVGIEMERK